MPTRRLAFGYFQRAPELRAVRIGPDLHIGFGATTLVFSLENLIGTPNKWSTPPKHLAGFVVGPSATLQLWAALGASVQKM